MRAIVTGAKGTVGGALCDAIRAAGGEAIAWDRSRIPIDDYHAMERFVRATAPDVLYHLAIASQPTGRDNEGWLVNSHWPSELAWIARQLEITFVFTSTVMVFTERNAGPYTPNSEPDAPDGYGGEKRRTEARVRSQNPEARVVRLGWQIGSEPGSNNMIDFLERKSTEEGAVRASTRWKPACSFLEDTADALLRVADLPAGLYQLDGNRAGHSFFDITSALNALHRGRWKIEATDDFVYDQRMFDDRLPVAPLAARLPGLAPVPRA